MPEKVPVQFLKAQEELKKLAVKLKKARKSSAAASAEIDKADKQK